MTFRCMFSLVTLSTLVFAQSASAQGPDAGKPATCYEVIPAQANAYPRTSMLVDKCGGRTWLLTKSRRAAGYSWVRVTTDDAGPVPQASATSAKAASSPSDSRNCFTFNNRRFCE